jgi:heme exporter protein D
MDCDGLEPPAASCTAELTVLLLLLLLRLRLRRLLLQVQARLQERHQQGSGAQQAGALMQQH